MRGHPAVIVAGALLLPAAVAAQALPGSAPVPGITVVWNAPPASSPPPSAPPASSHGTVSWHSSPGLTPDTQDQFLADAGTYAPRYGRRSSRTQRRSRFFQGYAPAIGGFVPYATPEATIPVIPDRRRSPEPDGRLLLRVTPGSTQVLVDGFYMGVAEDFADRGLWLEAGPRRVELRADGYETVTFDVRVVEGETVDYRKDLARATTRPAVAAVAAAPKSFYVIRGCYAGDVPPSTARLPAGCRAADVRVVPPVLTRVDTR